MAHVEELHGRLRGAVRRACDREQPPSSGGPPLRLRAVVVAAAQLHEEARRRGGGPAVGLRVRERRVGGGPMPDEGADEQLRRLPLKRLPRLADDGSHQKEADGIGSKRQSNQKESEGIGAPHL